MDYGRGGRPTAVPGLAFSRRARTWSGRCGRGRDVRGWWRADGFPGQTGRIHDVSGR